MGSARAAGRRPWRLGSRGDRGDARASTLNRRALASAGRLQAESPALARASRLVLAALLKGLVEAALEGVESRSPRPLEERLRAVASTHAERALSASDVVLELLEAEEILDDLIVAEEGPEALGGKHRRLLRTELRRAARSLAEQVEPGGYDTTADSPQMAALLEELPEAILIVDEQERVRYANARVSDAYGIESAQAVGRSLSDLLTLPELLLQLEDPDAFLDATLRLLAAPGEAHEDVFRHSDGATFLRRSVPAGEGGSLGRLVITANVTRLRERNRMLERKAEERPWAPPPAVVTAARPRLTVIDGGRGD